MNLKTSLIAMMVSDDCDNIGLLHPNGEIYSPEEIFQRFDYLMNDMEISDVFKVMKGKWYPKKAFFTEDTNV